jgi:hypothetical protein
METRSPDPSELKRMQSLVAEALDTGARGLSSGLSMTPGIFSMTSEVIAVFVGHEARSRQREAGGVPRQTERRHARPLGEGTGRLGLGEARVRRRGTHWKPHWAARLCW